MGYWIFQRPYFNEPIKKSSSTSVCFLFIAFQFLHFEAANSPFRLFFQALRKSDEEFSRTKTKSH